MSEILDTFFKEGDPKEYHVHSVKMILAAKIDEGIKAKGWSKQEFAHKIKVAPSVVTRWISGSQNFTADTLSEIEYILGIKIFDLTIDKEDQERKKTFDKFYQH